MSTVYTIVPPDAVKGCRQKRRVFNYIQWDDEKKPESNGHEMWDSPWVLRDILRRPGSSWVEYKLRDGSYIFVKYIVLSKEAHREACE